MNSSTHEAFVLNRVQNETIVTGVTLLQRAAVLAIFNAFVTSGALVIGVYVILVLARLALLLLSNAFFTVGVNRSASDLFTSRAIRLEVLSAGKARLWEVCAAKTFRMQGSLARVATCLVITQDVVFFAFVALT